MLQSGGVETGIGRRMKKKGDRDILTTSEKTQSLNPLDGGW
jgi:hypothetical protein